MSAHVAEILDRAAELIVKHGWWGHGGSSDRNKLCAWQALNRADRDHDDEVVFDGAADALVRHLPRPDSKDTWRAVTRWNDRKCRTADQVIFTLRLAAIRERSAEEDTARPAQRVGG